MGIEVQNREETHTGAPKFLNCSGSKVEDEPKMTMEKFEK